MYIHICVCVCVCVCVERERERVCYMNGSLNQDPVAQPSSPHTRTTWSAEVRDF